MIRNLFREILAREASRYLTKHRVRKERQLIKQVARELRRQSGLPEHRALME